MEVHGTKIMNLSLKIYHKRSHLPPWTTVMPNPVPIPKPKCEICQQLRKLQLLHSLFENWVSAFISHRPLYNKLLTENHTN